MGWKNYQIATAQESTPVPGDAGKIFYDATLHYVTIPSGATIVMSGGPNGEGETSVDDVVKLTLTDQSDPQNTGTYSHDYSNGCSGVVTPMQPVDLTSQFSALAGKTVKATIEFYDKCGGYQSGTNFYICIYS
ncbi:hypothetical protein [Leisingera thetidis]|uniref:hypothetical protein n=1 Tax=Leisingera thetidis TaxID=2930199 RepID=UPI0021F7CA3D|nr:hypothetical protein [Leisingera thetidis]